MSVAAVENKTVPQNYGYEDFDAEVGIEPLAQSRACDVENVLSVSLGFGGNNGAVVVSKNAQNASANFGKRRLFVFGVRYSETGRHTTTPNFSKTCPR